MTDKMAEDRYNLQNTAVKRILQEVKEMQSNPADDFMSLPLEENIFEWQFAIRGPSDTEFEGGIFHGRIQLPTVYPFKPPSFILLTPSGRFETHTKICLSISNHHPEHWQPSWSVRTALVALIAFMPTEPNGAYGSLDYKKEERRALAVKSRESAPKFGTPERQKLIDEIHEYMLSKSPSAPQITSPQNPTEQTNNTESIEQTIPCEDETANDQTIEENTQAQENTERGPEEVQPPPRHVPAQGSGTPSVHQPQVRVQKAADDRLLAMAAMVLAVAIMALLLKKFIKWIGHGALFMVGGS